MTWWTIWGGWILSAITAIAIYSVHRWYRSQERLLRERLEEVRPRRDRLHARILGRLREEGDHG